MDVRIETVKRMKVAGLPHTGPYHLIGHTWERLHQFLSESKQLSAEREMVSVYMDDPLTVDPAALRSMAAVGAKGVKVGDVLDSRFVGGGVYAVAHFVGPYSGLGAAWAALRGAVAERADVSDRAGACFEIYRNNPTNTPPSLLVTELYWPVSKKSDPPAKRSRAKATASGAKSQPK